MHRRVFLGFMAAGAAMGGAARAEEKKKKSGGENYLPLDTLTATIIRPTGGRGVLTVDCGLDVPDAKLRTFASQSLPRLRAAYVQVVQIYAAGLRTGAPPDAEFIARALQRQTDAILGRPGARVLLGAVVAN
jgi:hypothetical protein